MDIQKVFKKFCSALKERCEKFQKNDYREILKRCYSCNCKTYLNLEFLNTQGTVVF